MLGKEDTLLLHTFVPMHYKGDTCRILLQFLPVCCYLVLSSTFFKHFGSSRNTQAAHGLRMRGLMTLCAPCYYVAWQYMLTRCMLVLRGPHSPACLIRVAPRASYLCNMGCVPCAASTCFVVDVSVLALHPRSSCACVLRLC